MPNSRISDLIKKTVLISDGQYVSPDDDALFLIAREKSHNESMEYKNLKKSITDHTVFITGDQFIEGSKTFHDDVSIESDLSVDGDVLISGDLAVSGDFSVRGDIFNLKFDDGAGGNADDYLTRLDSNLETKGDARLESDLTVEEKTFLHGHVAIGDTEKGYLRMQSGGVDKIILDSDGASFLQGGDVKIGASGDLNNLRVVGKTTTEELEILQGTLVHQNLTVKQDAIIVNDATVQNDLLIEGNTLISGTLEVQDDLLVTASEARFVVDNAVFEKDVEIQGDLSVKGDLFNLKFDDGSGGNADSYLTQLDSNLVTKGTLSVDLDSTLKSNLNTQGNVTFDQKLDIIGQSTILDKLGVGTTSPQKTLEVAGDLRTTKTTADGGVLSLDLNTGGASDHPKLSLYDKNGGNEVNLLYSRLQFTRDAEAFISSKSDLKFVTNGEDRITITSDGNVGVGTSTPNYPLDVLTSDSFAARFRRGGGVPHIKFEDTSDSGDFSQLHTSNKMFLFSRRSASDPASNQNIWLAGTENGNVGIGTAEPSAQLEVVSPRVNDYAIKTTRADGTRLTSMFQDNNSNGTIGAYNSSDVAKVWLNTNGDSYFDGGNVGIGTTEPSQPLDVLGNFVQNDGSGAQVYTNFFNYGGTVGVSSQLRMFNEQSANNIAIRCDGDSFFNGGQVGIGTTTPNYKLDIQTESSVGLRLRNGAAGPLNSSNDAPSIIFQANGWDTDAGTQAYTGRIRVSGLYSGAAGRGNTHPVMVFDLETNENDPDDTASPKMSIGIDAVEIPTKLGIGTTETPDALLEIAGATNPELRITDTDPATASAGTFRAEDSGVTLGAYTNNPLYLVTNNSTKMTILANGNVGISNTNPEATFHVGGNSILDGNVGIGTSSPGAKLHIEDVNANNPGIKISASDLNYEHEIKANGDGLLLSADSTNYGQAGPDIRFNVSGSEHMRIQKNGNIGVGTTAASHKLHIAGGTPDIKLEGSQPRIFLKETDQTNLNTLIRNNNAVFEIDTVSDTDAYIENRFSINHANGNVRINDLLGIGKDPDGFHLDVAAPGVAGNGIRVQTNEASAEAIVHIGGGGSGDIKFKVNGLGDVTVAGATTIAGTTTLDGLLIGNEDVTFKSSFTQEGVSRFKSSVILDHDVLGGNTGSDLNIYTNSQSADLNLGAGNTKDLITLEAQQAVNPATGADSGQDILFNNSNVGINVPSVELSPVTQDKYKMHINGEVKIDGRLFATDVFETYPIIPKIGDSHQGSVVEEPQHTYSEGDKGTLFFNDQFIYICTTDSDGTDPSKIAWKRFPISEW